MREDRAVAGKVEARRAFDGEGGRGLDVALGALLTQPTATIASAVRGQCDAVAGIVVTKALRERLTRELEAATGDARWKPEYLRDTRPLFEFLQTQRLIHAQRRTLRCRFSSRS